MVVGMCYQRVWGFRIELCYRKDFCGIPGRILVEVADDEVVLDMADICLRDSQRASCCEDLESNVIYFILFFVAKVRYTIRGTILSAIPHVCSLPILKEIQNCEQDLA